MNKFKTFLAAFTVAVLGFAAAAHAQTPLNFKRGYAPSQAQIEMSYQEPARPQLPTHYLPRELEKAAQVVCGEMGGKSWRGQLLAAYTMIFRAAIPEFAGPYLDKIATQHRVRRDGTVVYQYDGIKRRVSSEELKHCKKPVLAAMSGVDMPSRPIVMHCDTGVWWDACREHREVGVPYDTVDGEAFYYLRNYPTFRLLGRSAAN